MKFVIFIASWLCFAFIQNVHAQTKPDTKLKDTLIIHLKGDNQVHIIGNSLEEIAKYRLSSTITETVSAKNKKKDEKRFNSPDSLKNLFLPDYQKAIANESITSTSKNIHYLISKEGKRRMKVATDSYTEEPFNLEMEIKRLEMKLPSYHFIIYDLFSAMEIHFYLEDSSSLTFLQTVNLDEALKYLDKQGKILNKNFRINIENENNGFNIREKKGSIKNQLEFSPFIGFGIIGSQPTPLYGVDLSYTLLNKYSKPSISFGIKYYGFSIANLSENNFISITPGIMADFYLSANSSKRNEVKQWLGTHWGIFIIEDEIKKARYAFQFGFHKTHGNILYSINLISNKPNNPIWAFSAKIPF